MNLKEIFQAIGKIGSLSVSTFDGENIQSRYINFFGYDDDGLYFMTMNVKPFYRQLSRNSHIAASGIYPSGAKTDVDEHGMPIRPPGFTRPPSMRLAKTKPWWAASARTAPSTAGWICGWWPTTCARVRPPTRCRSPRSWPKSTYRIDILTLGLATGGLG